VSKTPYELVHELIERYNGFVYSVTVYSVTQVKITEGTDK